jgi:putative PEP-CTERM system histidine kinase
MEIIKLVPLVNLVALAAIILYVLFKAKKDRSIIFFVLSLFSLALFELGSLLFFHYPYSFYGASLTLFSLALLPLVLIPMGQTLARAPTTRVSKAWLLFYALQLLIVVFVTLEIVAGRMIDWVTAILEQPVFLIEKQRRLVFLNTGVACIVTLICFENTLRNASKPQQERLRYIFISFLGVAFYFFYVSAQIVAASYLSQSLLLSGSVLIFPAISIIAYSLFRHPYWETTIFVSRRAIFGCLSFSAILLYLLVSGWLLTLLNAVQKSETSVTLPATLFLFIAVLLSFYLSPTLRKRLELFVTHNFFRNKHDYRDLWMQFSEKLGGSVILGDMLPKLSEFIADCIGVRQVVVWLSVPGSATFAIAHALDNPDPSTRRFNGSFTLSPRTEPAGLRDIFQVGNSGGSPAPDLFPLASRQLAELEVNYLLPVRKSGETLAWLGIGKPVGGENLEPEDVQLLTNIVNPLANLILTARLSSELLEAREWESFNRLASFVIHDLKNLATQQAIVLDNAKNLRHNADFLQDAFKTFAATTDKMISLIANLSVQRGHLVLHHQVVNIIDLLKQTIGDLKFEHRKEVRLTTEFPPQPSLVSGDPGLLEKAFTNILLNALQSLPDGKGLVHVKVSNPNGKILTAVSDSGCGISQEELRNLFRPFQSTKKGGMGVGLCHTRTIVESHGGHIRVDSEVNRGTMVEVEFPNHNSVAQEKALL